MIINYLYAFLISFDIAVFVPFRQHNSVSCGVVLQVFTIFFINMALFVFLRKKRCAKLVIDFLFASFKDFLF